MRHIAKIFSNFAAIEKTTFYNITLIITYNETRYLANE